MALNLLLLVYIRQNQFAIAVDKQRAAASGGDMTGTWHRPFPAGLLLITTTTPSQDSPTSVTATPKSAVTNKSTTPTGSCGNRALMVARAKREKKITIMVMVITFTFVVCNAPSAIFFILRQFGVMMSTRARENLLTGSLNCLVTTGKVLNFMLFCVASRHFRKQLGAHWRRFGRAIPRLRRMSNISQPAAYHNHNAHGHRSSRNTCITSTGDGPTTGERLPMLEKSDYLGDQQHNDGVFALALSAAPIRRRAAVQHNLTQQQQQQQPPQKEEPIELEATQQQPIEPEATQQQQQPSRHIALPSAPQDLQ